MACADVEATHVTIRAIAGGGDGVGTLDDGRTVFVPRAAPGDQVRLDHVHRHARFARGTIAEIVTPGPDRVAPPCPHYVRDQCGSCQLMHLTADAQRAAKSRIVGDALRRIARIDIADPPVVPAPDDWRYRSKVTFAVQDGRIGYHPVGRPDHVFDVVDCLIADKVLMQVHAVVRGHRGLLPRDATRVVLRLDRDSTPHVLVETSRGDVWTDAVALHEAFVASGIAAVVWWQPPQGHARVLAGAESPWPATVFEQVHPAMAQLVRQGALDALHRVDDQLVWDLYAGTGDTTAELAGRGARVESVERDARAVAFAEARGPAGPHRHADTVESTIEQLPAPDAVITNPPRTGMSTVVIDAIVRHAPARVVYVSCDPATLARDAAKLALRYALSTLSAFDQFPQTAHVECVGMFTLA